MSEGSQLKSNSVLSVTSLSLFLISLFTKNQGGGVRILQSDQKIWVQEDDFFIHSLHQFNWSRYAYVLFLMKKYFLRREIETFRHWVSCLNYFVLLKLLWQCKHMFSVQTYVAYICFLAKWRLLFIYPTSARRIIVNCSSDV